MNLKLPYSLDNQAVFEIARRFHLFPQLLRCQEEIDIVDIVKLPKEWISERLALFHESHDYHKYLEERSWSHHDLIFSLSKPEALHRFADYLFGSGLEEFFLSSNGGYDQVIYSLLRVRESALAQELWFRLCEGEATFAELANAFSQGPEAANYGIFGPLSFSQIQPVELASRLKTYTPGAINPPIRFGDWHVLIRLDSYVPARFDAKMKNHLLHLQLSDFISDRVESRLRGVNPVPLQYNP